MTRLRLRQAREHRIHFVVRIEHPHFLSDFAFGFDILANMSETDLQLLRRYTSQRAEDAFAEVVRRHLDLVHSAALRQVRSPELAEEVAQAVFIELARQARHLPPRTVLAAWLYHVTRRRAIDVVRREAGRRLREQTAQELQAMNATAEDWTRIEPLLDDAMAALEETDRLAVLLRYFQNKPLHEVGQAIGVTDDAAQKRVSRAVERLREFLAKRGVTTGASDQIVVISANAVQAAPAGLTAATLTATALAETAVGTTTTATATKAIAMTTFQKVLVGAALAAAVSTGIYEARQASVLRTQVRTLQQQQAPLAEQIDRLTRERDEALNGLTALRDESKQLNANVSELARLRAEVSRVRSQELAHSKNNSSDTTESSAKSWMNRVSQLKQRLEQNPSAKIPELRFVTEQDWLDAAKHELKTEADYRRALSNLRRAAEQKVVPMLKEALTGYLQSNNGSFPTDLAQLQPYFKPPLDDAVLQRWEIAPASTIENLGLGGDAVITQKAPIDDVFDARVGIGPQGTGSTEFFPWKETRELLSHVREAYRAAHNGQEPSDQSQLLPYATTPEQQVALQKWILRASH